MPAPAHKHDGQLILCCAHIVLTLRVIVGLARAVDTVELAVVEHTVVHLPTVLAAVRVRTRTGRVVTVMAAITTQYLSASDNCGGIHVSETITARAVTMRRMQIRICLQFMSLTQV